MTDAFTLDREPDPAARDHGIRVLIAEDIAVNRELVRLMLGPLGYRIDEVDDGDKAVEAIKAKTYDVVLMDIQMPVMDGIKATRAVREMGGRYADLPIIALSANVISGQVEQCLAAGMSTHLAKPFTAEALCGTIARWTQGSTPRPNIAPAAASAQTGAADIERLLTHLLDQVDAFNACEPSDRRVLQARAHALRGSAALMGYKTLALACRALEDACRMSQDPSERLASARDAARGARSDIWRAIAEARS